MPDSSLQFIVNVDSDNQQGLIQDFLLPNPALIPDFVRGDKTLAITIRPVMPSETANQENGRPWDDVFLPTDLFILAIGNPDQPATGGTFKLDLSGNSTGLTAIPYNASATDLQTPLSLVTVAVSGISVTVTKPATGTYVMTGNTFGGIPLLVADAINLIPNCEVIISQIEAGSLSTRAQQVISIRQQCVALSRPDILLPAAGVTRTYQQTATANQNNIVRIAFDADGTYGGLYSINVIAGGVSAACGQAGPLYTPEQLGLVLANHPSIRFQNPNGDADNIIVTQDGPDFLVEFTGTLAGSTLQKLINDGTVANPTVLQTTTAHGYRTGDSVTITASSGFTPTINGTHTITVTDSTHFSIPVNVTVASSESATAFNNSETTLTVANVNLLAPTGLTGTLNLNTYNLFLAFCATDEDSLDFEISIEWYRNTGEIRTILLADVTIKRDIIDLTSLVPVIMPPALTQNTGVNFNTATDTAGLKAVVTTSLTPPLALYYNDSTYGGVTYILTSGSTAESLPGIVRPNDYNVSTNAKIWLASS